MAGRAACELALITIHPKIVNLRTNCSRLRVEVVVSFIQSVDAKGQKSDEGAGESNDGSSERRVIRHDEESRGGE